jgi:hypothetical protein
MTQMRHLPRRRGIKRSAAICSMRRAELAATQRRGMHALIMTLRR